MKKFIAIVSVLALMTVCMTACSKKVEDKKVAPASQTPDVQVTAVS